MKTPPDKGRPPGKVRIIGGRWRGTRLEVADAAGLRPSADRVRETLFNWLQPALPGARVLDLFAGSGALGLESLSRGAREALLVERDPKLAAALQAAIARLHAEDEATVVRADALAFLRAPLHGRFDVVFVDPPFAGNLWKGAVDALAPWLAPQAWLYLESPAEAAIEPGSDWTPHREGRTREVRYALYRRVADGADTLGPVIDGPPATLA
ncbi:16S rRNA (guanine(966)-N(2))-methyltransferase RsmD [Luteimonas sp. SX5]|uniref:Ribosomal RNA small subunit methyltransferase D n=1 Tax=Luteimonas galliterrae TaxID=2940486 RepID=A0ABT0MDW8_9GAMM|nr:16S rRNA (guanine(966)-N(2))-methyltransferase RsmD [Luteimonas galliterrae]MCL1633072.1 16S rRNA (guanine(966)-N(2))-methyltransferase RsmD [Luteimonas galliterrae]